MERASKLTESILTGVMFGFLFLLWIVICQWLFGMVGI